MKVGGYGRQGEVVKSVENRQLVAVGTPRVKTIPLTPQCTVLKLQHGAPLPNPISPNKPHPLVGNSYQSTLLNAKDDPPTPLPPQNHPMAIKSAQKNEAAQVCIASPKIITSPSRGSQSCDFSVAKPPEDKATKAKVLRLEKSLKKADEDKEEQQRRMTKLDKEIMQLRAQEIFLRRQASQATGNPQKKTAPVPSKLMVFTKTIDNSKSEDCANKECTDSKIIAAELTKENEVLQRRYQAATKEFEKLHEEAENKKKGSKNELTNIKIAFRNLESENLVLSGERNMLNHRVNKISDKVTELQGQALALQERQQDLQNEKEDIRRKSVEESDGFRQVLAAKALEVEKLKEKQQTIEAERQKLLSQVSNLTGQINDAYERDKNVNAQLYAGLEQAITERQQSEEELKELKNCCIAHTEVVSENVVRRKELETLTQRLHQVDAKLKGAESELSALRGQYENEKSSAKRLATSLSTLKAKNEEEQKVLAIVRSDGQKVSVELINFKAKFASKCAELEKVKSQHEAALTDVKAIQIEYDSKTKEFLDEAKLVALRLNEEDSTLIERLRIDNEKLKAKLAAAEGKIKSLDNQGSRLMSVCHSVNNIHATFADESRVLHCQLKDSEVERARLEARLKEGEEEKNCGNNNRGLGRSNYVDNSTQYMSYENSTCRECETNRKKMAIAYYRWKQMHDCVEERFGADYQQKGSAENHPADSKLTVADTKPIKPPVVTILDKPDDSQQYIAKMERALAEAKAETLKYKTVFGRYMERCPNPPLLNLIAPTSSATMTDAAEEFDEAHKKTGRSTER